MLLRRVVYTSLSELSCYCRLVGQVLDEGAWCHHENLLNGYISWCCPSVDALKVFSEAWGVVSDRCRAVWHSASTSCSLRNSFKFGASSTQWQWRRSFHMHNIFRLNSRAACEFSDVRCPCWNNSTTCSRMLSSSSMLSFPLWQVTIMRSWLCPRSDVCVVTQSRAWIFRVPTRWVVLSSRLGGGSL